MSRRLAFTLVTALSAAGALHAQTTPAWITRSNADSRVLLDVIAQFSPESATEFGLRGYDTRVADLKPGVDARSRAALVSARAQLQHLLASEKTAEVRQDLQILVKAADEQIEGIDLNHKYLLPYTDVGKLIFGGEFALLKDDVDARRRAYALQRLQCYVGTAPGCDTPITQQAKAQTEARLDDEQLLGPYRVEIEQNLANTQRYTRGLQQLFVKYNLDDAQGKAALAALDRQLADYDAWVRNTVLPHARTDFRLPEPLYAYKLRKVGIDIPPQQLVKEAELEFVEVRGAMQMLAPVVAKAEGFKDTDYRSVMRDLKKDQLGADQVMPWYHQVLGQIEDIIVRERIVSLPQRKMQMRVASDAEAAQNPVPHMNPPPLLNNHGEQGTFVLTTGSGGKGEDSSKAFDDFTFKAMAWPMTAHEGRPGHELQFAAMVDRGVSLARSLFAFNSVNVEGWALYAEAEMLPYEPPSGQFATLKSRLVRAARAYLDPMLNLGLISRARALDVLTRDVGLSEAIAQQELDRYTFRSPGQATAYFYGYMRLQQLRLQTELALGPAFDRKAFNDFVISQGLLPPDQLADAVRQQFIPAQRKQVK